MTNILHHDLRESMEDRFRVLTTFDPADILNRKPTELFRLILQRVADSVASSIIEIFEPAFQQALKISIETIQEKINAPETTETLPTDTTENTGKENPNCSD